jgi:hypothetical protein
VLLYASGEHRDFIAVELYKSRLRYVYNTGDGAKVRPSFMRFIAFLQILLGASGHLSDYHWHTVMIVQRSNSEHTLLVDGQRSRAPLDTAITSAGGGRRQLNVRGPLYVGGVGVLDYRTLPNQGLFIYKIYIYFRSTQSFPASAIAAVWRRWRSVTRKST